MANSKSKEEKIISEKKNEVRRTINAEKNKIWDKKYNIEINIYI